jgi:release factor glutamine methyltransferase
MNNNFMEKEYLPQRKFSKSQWKEWYDHIFNIYDRMKATSKDGPYEVEFGDLKLDVLPNVYSLLFFSDTLWFAKKISKIVGSKSLLEIGTGTGAIAVLCANNGAEVVATDINPDAVENAKLNAKRYNLQISVRQGDMYSPIKDNEKFDYIFWSHPFNNWDTPVDDLLLQSGMDYHYEGLEKYISQVKNHLKEGGKLLLGTGDTADLKTIAEFGHKSGYTMKLLDQIEIPIEIGSINKITDLLYEFEKDEK